MAAALGTTGQREVNKPSTQKAKQKSKCLTRSILLLPVQNQSKVRLKKDRHAQIDSGSMHDEERGFDKMADFVENGTPPPKDGFRPCETGFKIVICFQFCVGWVLFWNRTNVSCVF